MLYISVGIVARSSFGRALLFWTTLYVCMLTLGVCVFRGHLVVQASGAQNEVGTTWQHQRTIRCVDHCLAVVCNAATV